MKKFWVIFFSTFCLCLVWCWWWTQLKHNIIDVKYANEPVDLYWFDSFDTSRSSFIKEAYYDENNKYLIFNLTWTYYHWCDVPRYIWDEFKESDTIWWYFNKYIKGDYACRDLKAEEEEAQRLAEEQAEKEAKEKQVLEEMARQAEIEREKEEAQKKKCESLRADANRAIAEIQSNKSTVACDTMHNYESQMQQYQNLINNVDKEANSAFKWDVPQYMVSSYKNNKIQQYKNEISKLESMYYSASSRCSMEQSYNRRFDELILEWQQTLVNEWC